jgi:hypothetical protein
MLGERTIDEVVVDLIKGFGRTKECLTYAYASEPLIYPRTSSWDHLIQIRPHGPTTDFSRCPSMPEGWDALRAVSDNHFN